MKTLKDMHKKYFDLVWLSRVKPLDDEDFYDTVDPTVLFDMLTKVGETVSKYPEEAMAIRKKNKGAYYRGFNEGMLACLNFIYTMNEESFKQAIKEFPMLDT